MTSARVDETGAISVEAASYRLEVAASGLVAKLSSPAGEEWAALRPLAALDAAEGADETTAVSPPRVVAGGETTIEIERRSTLWDRAGVTVTCADATLDLRAWVEGRGTLTDVHLLGCRSVIAGRPTGFLPSGSTFRTLFSPNPERGSPLRAAAESAIVGVVGDSEPGRGHWFFTPAPLYLALGDGEAGGGWLGVALAAPVQELTFVELAYEARASAFSLRLDYDGHTRVDGRFQTPALVLTPGNPDPYLGLRRHRDDLVARRAAPAVRDDDVPRWWRDPIFCGWGAQCHLAATNGGRAADACTQANYDAFLAQLERNGVTPRTVVIDDKWQAEYGTCVPDRAKWPDLRGWIARQHAAGRRVLVWWKAWDPEGLPPELCIRNRDGEPIALDPGNAAARDELREAVARLLSPAGLDADGLKIDFTGRAPTGRSLAARGPAWGIALLHELLATVYGAAKAAKPDALVITHTPHPAFVDVSDMIRLNDMLGGGDPDPASVLVADMRYRAAVARAACPELLIDTDDWPVPTRDAWRAYLAVKRELGVPSLYYATHIDATGEPLEREDYEALRTLWSS